MMFVVKTDEDKERLLSAIRLADWSFKVYLEPLFPKATPDQYRYLFGVVYKRIAEFQGHTNVWDVHADMMEFFNMEYKPNDDGIWEFRTMSGKKFTTVSIAQYIEKLRAYWLVDWKLNIEDSTEIFANE